MQRIGVFVCHCGSNIAATVDVKKVVELAAKEPGVVHAEDYQYMCSEAGQAKIQEAIREKNLTGVVVCSCSPRMHEATFRKAAERAGLNPYMVEIANIREHCSWIHKDMEEATKKAVIDALQVMAEKTGIHGMLGGQSVDVENDGKALEKDMLDYIYENKTAALIEASMMTGAILAGADAEQVSVIEQAAKRIGLAFQIQDDILDVTSTDEELGKPVHSDEKNHKVTYVTLFGTEKAAAQVAGLSAEAVELLESLNKNNEFLYLLVEKLVNRRK